MSVAGALADAAPRSFAARLERVWRQIGTGVAFSLFGIGGLILALLVFPAINLFYWNREARARAAQHTVHATWRLFIWIVVAMGIIAFECEGGELLEADTGTLVIANHPSLLDVVLIMSLMRRTQCVVKPGVWHNPFMRGAVRAANYIPNLGDPEQTLRACIEALRAGNNLVIFPEGSRTRPGESLHLERGFANIAIRANAPIRLVTVSCTPPTLRKGEKWYQSPLHKPRFRVRACDRLETGTICGSGVPSRDARHLTAHVTRRLEELIAHESA